MGFSAGGHLAARTSAQFDKQSYEPVGETDKLSCRPDFCILIYPAYLAKKDQLDFPVNKQTPPTIIVQTEDDKKFVAGTKVYSKALEEAGITSKFLLFKKGGHGYGMRAAKDSPLAKWPEQCGEWLKTNGFTGKD
jgi:acetyl esterase/lipase